MLPSPIQNIAHHMIGAPPAHRADPPKPQHGKGQPHDPANAKPASPGSSASPEVQATPEASATATPSRADVARV
jgi:hypothetical protein